MQTVQDFGAHSSRWDVFIIPYPQCSGNLYGREGRETVRGIGG